MLETLLVLFGLKEVTKELKKYQNSTSGNSLGVYRDGNGDERLVSTKRKVYRTQDYNGDYVYKDIKSNRVVLNVDEIQAHNRKMKAINMNHKFFLRQVDDGMRYKKLGNFKIKGDRYCETRSNIPAKYDNVYVKRKIMYRYDDDKTYYGEFFMDMHSKLYSPTDETIASDKNSLKENGKHMSEMVDYINLYRKIIAEWNSSPIKIDAYDDTCYVIGTYKKTDIVKQKNRMMSWKNPTK